MAETEYITLTEAGNLLPQPLSLSTPDKVIHAIRTASDEIEKYISLSGMDIVIPIIPEYITDDFKIAVAYWSAGCLFWSHGDPDQGKKFKDEAKRMIDAWISTTPFTETKQAKISPPTAIPYSSKGNVKLTDLQDPLDLDETE